MYDEAEEYTRKRPKISRICRKFSWHRKSAGKKRG